MSKHRKSKRVLTRNLSQGFFAQKQSPTQSNLARHDSQPESLRSVDETESIARILHAWRYPEPGSQVEAIVRKWRNFDFTVQRNGEWLLEGFANYIQMFREIARAVDPDFPDKLPAHCFSAKHIAEFFRLPEDAFREQRLDDSKDDLPKLIREIHQTTVLGPKQRLATLKQIQRDLYDVASEETLMMGAELCELTGLHDYDSNSRTAMAELVNLDLFRKIKGRRGYLKVPL